MFSTDTYNITYFSHQRCTRNIIFCLSNRGDENLEVRKKEEENAFSQYQLTKKLQTRY